MFDHISKHLEVCQKYSAARRIFNSLLGVWKCGQTRSFVFDIIITYLPINIIATLKYGEGWWSVFDDQWRECVDQYSCKLVCNIIEITGNETSFDFLECNRSEDVFGTLLDQLFSLVLFTDWFWGQFTLIINKNYYTKFYRILNFVIYLFCLDRCFSSTLM